MTSFFQQTLLFCFCGILEPGPNAAIVGGLLKGQRMAEAQGRDVDGETAGGGGGDVSRKHQYITEILKWRASTNPDQ